MVVTGTAARPAAKTEDPEDRPRLVQPRRVRTSLTLGVMGGDVLAGTIAIPIRIGLYTLNPGATLQGIAALVVQPLVFVGFPPGKDTRYLNIGGGLALAAGWEQRLGPVEVFPRFGVSTAIAFRLQGSTPFRLDLLVKGLVGLSVAVPAGERTKFLAGFDAHIGPENLYVGYIGVGF